MVSGPEDVLRAVFSTDDILARPRALQLTLSRPDPSERGAWLAELRAAALDGDPRSMVAWTNLVALCALVARDAEHAGMPAVDVLEVHDPLLQADLRALEATAHDDPRREIVLDGRKLSLGERRSLCRARDRKQLVRALNETDPLAMRILLQNPNIRVSDVVRISASPSTVATLREVAAHAGWLAHNVVRSALAQNPIAPDPLRRLLLPCIARDARAGVERWLRRA